MSAGIVPVRGIGGEARFLLLRCYGYWDFPKGEVERDEDPLTAAKRECEEETGLRGLEFRWGQQFIETERYGRGKIARYYIAEAPAGDVTLPVNPELGRAEHQEYRWTSVAEARGLLNARLLRVLDWACARLRTAPDQEQG